MTQKPLRLKYLLLVCLFFMNMGSVYSQTNKLQSLKTKNETTKVLPKFLPKKQLINRAVSNKTIVKPINKLTRKTPKYRTLYVMVYKDKFKTHEFKFMKDVHNHKNTALKWKSNKKVITKKLPFKEGIHIEQNFSKIWGDSKYRSPSRLKKCTPYVNLASLLGKQTVCAENRKSAFQTRNFLNELNTVFKASK